MSGEETPPTTTARTAFRPNPPPKMGGLVQVKHDTFSAWTGGKPLHDWSDLDASAPGYEQTAQLRPTYEDKGFSTRCTGFATKFTKNSSLHLFQRKLMDHFVTHGMDSITYLPDPAAPTTMVSVITHHTRFTTELVKIEAPKQAANYDAYDRANDRAARLALVDCFDDALRLEIEERIPEEPTFHMLWMLLIQIIQSDSMGKFTQMTNEIKQQKPQMYAGQNIAEMALAISTRATALSTAGLYDLQLNGTILKAFLMADGNDEYKFELMKTQSLLTAALKEVRFMPDKLAASTYLSNLDLGHVQLCALAESKYREAIGDGIWPPATNNRDSKAAPAGYYTAAQLNALVQQFGSPDGLKLDKSSDTCHYCGEPGHWARDCPKKARDLAQRGGGRGGRGGRGPVGRFSGRGRGRGHHQGRGGRGGGGRNGRSSGGPRRESPLGNSWHPLLATPKPKSNTAAPFIGVPHAHRPVGLPLTAPPRMAPVPLLKPTLLMSTSQRWTSTRLRGTVTSICTV